MSWQIRDDLCFAVINTDEGIAIVMGRNIE